MLDSPAGKMAKLETVASQYQERVVNMGQRDTADQSIVGNAVRGLSGFVKSPDS